MKKVRASSNTPLSLHSSINNDYSSLEESPYLAYKKRKDESIVKLKRIYS